LFTGIPLVFVIGSLKLGHDAIAITNALTALIFTAWVWSLARFGFVLPIVATEGTGAFQAFQRSELLSEPIRGRIFLLLIESEIAGFCAASLPFWILRWAGVRSVLSWESWLLVAASVSGAAITQIPMMVGVSRLYSFAHSSNDRKLAATSE
jgi:hypothetical protein